MPRAVFAANSYTFSFPGTLKLGTSGSNTSTQRYIDHSFTYTVNGVKHNYKMRWSQYVNGEFQLESGLTGIWLYKISGAWIDGKEDTSLDLRKATYFLRSQPMTASTNGKDFTVQRKVTDVVYVQCQGNNLPSTWYDWFGSNDCAGQMDGAQQLIPRGQSTWNVWVKSAEGCNANHTCGQSFIGDYIYRWGEWVRANTPILQEVSLPRAAVDACNSSYIKPQSDTDWSLINEVLSLAKTVGENAKDSNNGDIPYGFVFNTKNLDKATDQELYRIFYQEGKDYSNKHVSKGDQLDQLMSQALAEINSWSQADIEGTHLKFGKFDVTNSLYKLAGADIVANGLAAGTAIGTITTSKLANTGASLLVKAGTGKNWATLSKMATGLASTGVSTGASATKLAGTLASKANVVALAFSISITAVAYGTNSFFQSRNDAYYKTIFESLLADYYISKHLEFHECILNLKGEQRPSDDILSATGFTQEIFEAEGGIVEQLSGEAGSGLANTTNYVDKTDVCGCPGSGGNLIFQAIKQAICSLLCILYEWGVGLNQAGAEWFNKAIGTISNKTSP